MSIRRVKPWHRPAEQRYRLRGWRRWLMWWMFAPMLLAGSVLAGWEWLWRRTTLELSPTGLRLRQLGYTLETAWSNIAGFHADPGHEGFVLAQPLDTAGARRLASFGYLAGQYTDDQASWIARQRFIPIEAFGWHLRRGALADDVSARAPQLAAAMRVLHQPPPRPTTMATSPPATPLTQRRRNVLL